MSGSTLSSEDISEMTELDVVGDSKSEESVADTADFSQSEDFESSQSNDTSMKDTDQESGTGSAMSTDSSANVRPILQAIENSAATVKCSPEEFCLSQSPCTLQQFDSLKATNKFRSLMKIINQFKDDQHLLLLIFTSLKCAHLSQLSAEALQLAIALFEETFDYARLTDQEERVKDYYLQQLGLLRSEESFISHYDIKSCRYALREALSSEEFASEQIKNKFKVFLDNMDP